MSVTKSDLIEQLSEQAKLPKGKAELIVNVIFDSMVDALRRGDRIEVRGFGSFEVRDYGSYEGRNPRTGDPVHVEPKRLPFFKVGKELRERVNQGIAQDGARRPDGAARDHDDDSGDDDGAPSSFTASGSGMSPAEPTGHGAESSAHAASSPGPSDIESSSFEY